MIPQTLEQLLSQAQSIAGLTFGELADELHIPVPPEIHSTQNVLKAGWGCY